MTLNLTHGRVVIVGAGQAAGELTGALRQQGFTGQITMIGDEPHLPYRRPPLSKAYLSGDMTLEALFLKPAATYEKQGVDCRLGVSVRSIDRQAHQVSLSDGTTLPYDKLVLATGGRVRRLPLPLADAPNVHYVRGIDDIQRLQPQFTQGRRLVIIGGGYIGLEAAAVGTKKGLQVTVIEAMPRVLARVTVPELSAFYERVHRGHGVDIRTGAGVQALEGEAGAVTAVVLSDGQRVPADLVIVGIGLLPNTELAEAAGLAVANGIVVDAFTQTFDPDILACGDCTFHENRFYGCNMRLESVPNALEQARIAAGVLVGKPTPYAAVPWFWSDQYDLKLQMVGLSEGFDTFVVRGSMDANHFIALYLKDGMVIAADAVNRAADFMVAKRLVAERVVATPAQLADESVPLKALLAPAASPAA
jgi:3-phenylpropionate/trans-cinnamate dioxygenase ferredoxin reductase subunit